MRSVPTEQLIQQIPHNDKIQGISPYGSVSLDVKRVVRGVTDVHWMHQTREPIGKYHLFPLSK